MTISLIGMMSCEKSIDNASTSTNEGYANLTISLDSPALQFSTRTLASDPKNAGGSWTNWEKFCDGALLYQVTIFVVKDGTLVAYRNLYSGSKDIDEGNGFYENENSAVNIDATTGVAVQATFDSSNPIHGNIERLKAGTYQIIAVANYAPITTENTDLFADGETAATYAGLGAVAEDGTDTYNGDGNFSSIVSSIISNFNTTTGLPDFTKDGKNGSALFTYQLNSGDDRVCKILPQPLVMIRNVTLNIGDNSVGGKLSRTFARIRLEVKNNDNSSMIGISALSFQDNYASQKTYLFNDVAAGTANMYQNFALYESSKGAIGVTSEDAITPASSTIKRLPAGVTNTMLDCYILEGMISAEYAFEFWATHWTSGSNQGTTANYHITSFYANEGNSGYGLLDFMVYLRDSTGSSSKYLLGSETDNQFSQSGTVKTTYISELAEGYVIEPKYVWEIVLTSDTSYSSQVGQATGTLQSLSSGLYLQPYDGSTDMTPKLADAPGALTYKINFGGQVENGTIFSYYDGYYYYLDSDSNHTLSWVKGGTSISSSYEFLAFETIPGEKGSAETITVQKSITNSSATVSTNEIVRNDFFYGIIPLSISSSSADTSSSESE